MKLRLTPTEAYQRKQRVWSKYCDWARRVRRAFFPDTAGVSLYLHNWYICNRTSNPSGADLAEWVESSTYARYQRINAKLEARETRRTHEFEKHDPSGFWPYWCPLCRRYEIEQGAKH